MKLAISFATVGIAVVANAYALKGQVRDRSCHTTSYNCNVGVVQTKVCSKDSVLDWGTALLNGQEYKLGSPDYVDAHTVGLNLYDYGQILCHRRR